MTTKTSRATIVNDTIPPQSRFFVQANMQTPLKVTRKQDLARCTPQ
jgi:hypothetical protein